MFRAVGRGVAHLFLCRIIIFSRIADRDKKLEDSEHPKMVCRGRLNEAPAEQLFFCNLVNFSRASDMMVQTAMSDEP